MNGPRVVDGWNQTTGSGLDPQGKARFRVGFVLDRLVDALVREPAFWQHAALAQTDREAHAGALRYGRGDLRRALLGRLLLVAGTAPDRAHARRWLGLLTVEAYWCDEALPSRGPYAARPDFRQLVEAGTRAIARRGASKCLICGRDLSGTGVSSTTRGMVSVRRDYCRPHERMTDPLTAWRERAVAATILDAARACHPALPSDLALVSVRGAVETVAVFDEIRASDVLRIPARVWDNYPPPLPVDHLGGTRHPTASRHRTRVPRTVDDEVGSSSR